MKFEKQSVLRSALGRLKFKGPFIFLMTFNIVELLLVLLTGIIREHSENSYTFFIYVMLSLLVSFVITTIFLTAYFLIRMWLSKMWLKGKVNIRSLAFDTMFWYEDGLKMYDILKNNGNISVLF